MLGDVLLDRGIENNLSHAPEAVFDIWRNREGIEIEAAIIFKQLGHDLQDLYGKDDLTALLSLKSSKDELRHALRCQEILSFDEKKDYPALKPDFKIQFGPEYLTNKQRVLYMALGVCCITETLSTALLIEMHERAFSGIIRNTIHEILVDEIDHSRIGWAELGRQAQTEDISWLKQYVPVLVKEAFSSDISPMLKQNQDLSIWGILSPKDAGPIMEATLEKVIYPGLKQFGISLELT